MYAGLPLVRSIVPSTVRLSVCQFTYQPFENKRVELSVCHRDVCNGNDVVRIHLNLC